MNQKDYYDVLGVAKEASSTEIKEAYRDLAFRYHPDRNHSNSDAMDMMKSVNEAYAVLSNPEKREEYDVMRQQYGNSAYSRFRNTYTDQDIYSDSDIHHIFEEMARSFGIRGFDEIFKEAQAQMNKTQSFEHKRPGVKIKGFAYSGQIDPSALKVPFVKQLGKISRMLLGIPTGETTPNKGRDIHDVIQVLPHHALTGGPFAYHHRKKKTKLIVTLPAGLRDGQKIRLPGMGEGGKKGGVSGDLYIKVNVKKSLKEQVKGFLTSFRKK